jgi:hypothetical protein
MTAVTQLLSQIRLEQRAHRMRGWGVGARSRQSGAWRKSGARFCSRVRCRYAHKFDELGYDDDLYLLTLTPDVLGEVAREGAPSHSPPRSASLLR